MPALDVARLEAHVRFLADDRLEGRGVGTEGIEIAAEYVAGEFEMAGLAPAGENHTFFQTLEVTTGQQLTDEAGLMIDRVGDGELHEDFLPFSLSASESFEGPLAFVGYGVTNEEAGYDDYAGFEAGGKVLLMFLHEPHDEDRESKFGDEAPSLRARLDSKSRLAREHGAVGALIVNPPKHHDETAELSPFHTDAPIRQFALPMLQVSRAFAARILDAAGVEEDLAALQTELDERRVPRSMDLGGLTARGNPGIERPRSETRNVIGMISGDGPNADEIIVIGGHYDHLGVTVPYIHHGDRPEGDAEPQIHNGADDNASGTAGVIELAHAFAGVSLNRSMMFIAFTAEEIGLLGSQHFVDNPTVALDQIVAMINLDMIGRLREDRLTVFGVRTAESFEPLVERHAGRMGFDLTTSAGGFGPSDHTSFYAREIPVLHFFTGLHEDYHMPTDVADRVNFEGGRRVTEMVYRVAYELNHHRRAPVYVAVVEERPQMGSPAARVRLGVMPSYTDDEAPGLRLSGVMPESPAARAGLQAGDRLLAIGEHAVDDAYNLMDVLARHEPGDEVEVSLIRDGEEVRLTITFEAR